MLSNGRSHDISAQLIICGFESGVWTWCVGIFEGSRSGQKMLFTSLSPDPMDLYTCQGMLHCCWCYLSKEREDTRRAMYPSDLIIEVDVFMVLYNGCLRHNTFQGQPIRLQSASKKRLTSFLLRFSSVKRSPSRNLNPYCIIFAVRSPFQPASITSFLCHFFRNSSFCVLESSINGFPLCDLRNIIIRDQTS